MLHVQHIPHQDIRDTVLQTNDYSILSYFSCFILFLLYLSISTLWYIYLSCFCLFCFCFVFFFFIFCFSFNYCYNCQCHSPLHSTFIHVQSFFSSPSPFTKFCSCLARSTFFTPSNTFLFNFPSLINP